MYNKVVTYQVMEDALTTNICRGQFHGIKQFLAQKSLFSQGVLTISVNCRQTLSVLYLYTKYSVIDVTSRRGVLQRTAKFISGIPHGF